MKITHEHSGHNHTDPYALTDEDYWTIEVDIEIIYPLGSFLMMLGPNLN